MAAAFDTHQELARRALWKRLTVALLLALVLVAAYTQWGHLLTLESLARRESQLRWWQQQHPILVYCLAFLIYVTVVGLSLPGAAALSLVYGWYFGMWQGIVLVSFASTAGATLAFLLSRFLFREAIQQRFGERLERFNRALEREGPSSLSSTWSWA
jgi:uncharacterized membrane protein YdjX (TVP38/TMEM64 family)